LEEEEEEEVWAAVWVDQVFECTPMVLDLEEVRNDREPKRNNHKKQLEVLLALCSFSH
jgi:hypothetical protein